MADAEKTTAATTVGEIVIHLDYLKEQVKAMAETMAKKTDIDDLKSKLEGYATNRETELLKIDIADLRRQLSEVKQNVAEARPSSWLSKLGSLATHLMAVVGVVVLVASIFANGVRLADSLPAPKVAKP